MQNNKWVAVAIHNNKSDYNYTLKFFEGSVNDFEKSRDIFNFFDTNNKVEFDNCYLYSRLENQNELGYRFSCFSANLKIDSVNSIYLIPSDKIQEKQFLFLDRITNNYDFICQ